MNKKWLYSFLPVIFWASLWGITEATVGYVLHLLPIHIGWMFWYPIAFYYMNKIYERTQKPLYVLYAALISAAVKLLDLFLPVRIDMVINPAASIVLEGLVLFVLYRAMDKYSLLKKYKILLVTGANTLWRGLYLVYILITPGWMIALSPLSGIKPLIQFLVVQNLGSGILIYTYLISRKFLYQALQKLAGRLKVLSKIGLEKLNINSTAKQVCSTVVVLFVNILLHFLP